MRMNARRTKTLFQRRLMRAQRALSREAAAGATKVVVHRLRTYMDEAGAAFSRQPEGTGLAGALALSLGSPIAPCYLPRLASRHHPRQAYPSRPRGLVQRLPAVPDFWRGCGYRLLAQGAEGTLRLTDDFLRSFLTRPELAAVPDSGPAELALH